MSEKEVLGLEDKRFGAMIKGDVNALDAMVHDQLLYTHSSGNTDTKPSWLESIKSGRTKYKAVNCSDRKVRLFGGVALITGRVAIEAEIGGQPRSLKLLFLNAWTKTPEGWKIRRLAIDAAAGLSELAPRRFAAVPKFGSDRRTPDMPP